MITAINKGLEFQLVEPLPGNFQFVYFSPSKLEGVKCIEIQVMDPAGFDGTGDAYEEYRASGFLFDTLQHGPITYAQYAVSKDRKSLYYYGHFSA